MEEIAWQSNIIIGMSCLFVFCWDFVLCYWICGEVLGEGVVLVGCSPFFPFGHLVQECFMVSSFSLFTRTELMSFHN